MDNNMDKKTMIENLARAAYERGSLNGAWLYAEGGEIVSKGALGFRDPENTLLQATCAIPLMFPVIHYEGKPLLDGGCADPIPWKRALEAGCDRVVVILTREREYRRETGGTRALDRAFRKYPAFLETMHRRSAAYNACRAELFAQEAEGKVLVLAPEDTLGCSRTERDLEILRALWQEG